MERLRFGRKIRRRLTLHVPAQNFPAITSFCQGLIDGEDEQADKHP
jgi:hypothetical protein